jgi:hypothetical protein
MKIKSAIFCILQLIGYSFLVNYFIKISHISGDQGQWSSNLIKTQSFLYDYSPKQYNCLIGTSLTARLHDLPHSFYCFGLSGLSVIDGLKILKHKKQLPDTLLVEINLLATRPESEEFIKKIAPNKFFVELKENAFLQERYIPLGILSNSIMNVFEPLYAHIKPYYFILAYKIGQFFSNNTTKNNELSFEKAVLLGLQTKEIDTIQINHRFQEISNILTELEKKSVVLVFYELPSKCENRNSASISYNRMLSNKKFNPTQYKYISDKNCEKYSFTDGIHLDEKSAKSACHFLLTYLRLP